MSAQIVIVDRRRIWSPGSVQRLWFFPEGSQYLRYAPHFHFILEDGFRQNLPLSLLLSSMFVIVLEGKLSIKDFLGNTTHKVEVRDQVWYMRGGENRCPNLYVKTVPGR